jgi:hypothetical protein
VNINEADIMQLKGKIYFNFIRSLIKLKRVISPINIGTIKYFIRFDQKIWKILNFLTRKYLGHIKKIIIIQTKLSKNARRYSTTNNANTQ